MLNKFGLGTGRDNNGEVAFLSDDLKIAIVQVGNGSLQENKTGKRYGDDRDKTWRRQGQDRDKAETRQGQDRDKTGTRQGQN